jgi:hypothetical protein
MIPHLATARSNATSDMMRVLNQIEDKHACPLERVGLTVEQVRSMTRAMHRQQVARETWQRESEPLDEYVLGMVSRHKRLATREIAQLSGESPQAVSGSYRRLRRAGFPIKKESVRVASATGSGGVTRVELQWEGDES